MGRPRPLLICHHYLRIDSWRHIEDTISFYTLFRLCGETLLRHATHTRLTRSALAKALTDESKERASGLFPFFFPFLRARTDKEKKERCKQEEDFVGMVRSSWADQRNFTLRGLNGGGRPLFFLLLTASGLEEGEKESMPKEKKKRERFQRQCLYMA